MNVVLMLVAVVAGTAVALRIICRAIPDRESTHLFRLSIIVGVVGSAVLVTSYLLGHEYGPSSPIASTLAIAGMMIFFILAPIIFGTSLVNYIKTIGHLDDRRPPPPPS